MKTMLETRSKFPTAAELSKLEVDAAAAKTRVERAKAELVESLTMMKAADSALAQAKRDLALKTAASPGSIIERWVSDLREDLSRTETSCRQLQGRNTAGFNTAAKRIATLRKLISRAGELRSCGTEEEVLIEIRKRLATLSSDE
jgi:hypothetical protein